MECGKGGWVRNMARCTGDFGWSGMEVDAVRSLSDSEIREMLVSVAWRNVTSVMNKDMEEKPKLRILKEIADLKLESRCALVKKKRERSMLMKLRGGTAAFQVEVGRWRGVKREERICRVSEWRDRRCLPLAAAMSCLGPHQTAAVYSTSIERLTRRGNSGATDGSYSIYCLFKQLY